MIAADLNRARALALRLLRDSGWPGPARVSVELADGRLRISAEPAANPLTDSSAPPTREVSDEEQTVEKLAERIKDRVARRS